jgi:magnesium transporter
MQHTYTYKRLTWIDMESPTSDEIAKVMNTYKLHPLVAEELANPTFKPKVDYYKNYLYVVLRFPVRTRQLGNYVIAAREVDFVIGKDFIITSRHDTVEALHNFSKMFEVNSIVDKGGAGEHGGIVFSYMFKHIYKNMLHELENIRTALVDTEHRIFSGEEKNMVRNLSVLSRELINFRQIIRTHKDVLDSYASAAQEFFGEDYAYTIGEMQTEYVKTYETITNARELVNDLRDTNDSLLTTSQNETARTLTIMAFITLPLTLIAAVFSMKTENMPIIGSPFDFEIIVSIMIVAMALMFIFFKRKKWL